MKQSTYNVSPETGMFVDVLRAYEQAKDLYLKALNNLYGEQEGERIYTDNYDALTAAETVFLSGLNASVMENVTKIDCAEI